MPDAGSNSIFSSVRSEYTLATQYRIIYNEKVDRIGIPALFQ